MFSLPRFRLAHLSTGFIAALVGYASAIAIVIQAAEAAGADSQWLGSWLVSLGLVMGLTSIGLSWRYKMPVLTAWSTPGAALLASSLGDATPAQTVGCFLFAAALSLLLAVSGGMAKVQRWIPKHIAAGMLAGVLVSITIKITGYVEQTPLLLGGMLVTYIVAKRWLATYTMPLVLLCGLLLSFQLDLYQSQPLSWSAPTLYWQSPEFSFDLLLGVGFPLFLVTLSSQNIAGLAVMQAHGFKAPVSRLLGHCAWVNLLTAPFGCFSFGLSSITAAICMNPQVEANKDKRYQVTIWAGVIYLIAGLMGSLLIALVAICPQALIIALAAFGLLSTIANSLHSALAEPKGREGALVCFLVTAAGFGWWGVGAPFWGLLLGVLVDRLLNLRLQQIKAVQADPN
ncbi:benzoate/H(+) symporter BenE family transporter [Aliagarivorans taiwanensis]|uniref:benzoate/H(+) symporter BenE family transporter n=1 Tax=Aliagarivorans taiwanensis TaxID=561966 RepID=UPI00041D3B2D|nr:benzoate/H(+) symporter BenE family transporter [Aliagarivorans taiwanensis]